MKVKRNKSFEPIVITIENDQELHDIYWGLNKLPIDIDSTLFKLQNMLYNICK
jgi:hypothetical protein